jgi:hypothetical protein
MGGKKHLMSHRQTAGHPNPDPSEGISASIMISNPFSFLQFGSLLPDHA